MAGLQIQTNTTFANCTQLDLICVPGGNLSTAQQMTDPETLNTSSSMPPKQRLIPLMLSGVRGKKQGDPLLASPFGLPRVGKALGKRGGMGYW